MLCSSPVRLKNLSLVRCGQCMPCRIIRRRRWTMRLLLEASCHAETCFATLTYSDQFLPPMGSLVPDHGRLFVKRLRRRLPPRSLRFFGVGEYGSETWRPHFHYIFFGLGVSAERLIADAWRDPDSGKPIGHIHVGDATRESMQYVCGYNTKRMTSPDDPRLNGRHPEFFRFSNRPGIGANAISAIADAVSSHVSEAGFVPSEFLLHGKKFFLDTYLRKKLFLALGFSEEEFSREKEISRQELLDALFQLRAEARASGEYLSDKDVLLSSTAQKRLNIEGRDKIARSKKL